MKFGELLRLQAEALEQQAAWCRRFAQVNAVGLRKVPVPSQHLVAYKNHKACCCAAPDMSALAHVLQ